MNMIKAFKETLELAQEHHLHNVSSEVPESDYHHLHNMLNHAVMARQGNEFSDTKLARWLGWAQACVVINSRGNITLEDMKRINRENA